MALTTSRKATAQSAFAVYDGPLFVTFAADGAWDVASFCDPKGAAINAWIGDAEYQEGATSERVAGNIPFSTFGNNSLLFDNHHQNMLVVNGIDSQTAAHAVGIRHNWSGRIERGMPVIAALYAGVHGQGLPLPYLTNGGYRETGGAIPFTLIEAPSTLADLTQPNLASDGVPLLPPTMVDLVRQRRLARRQGMLARPALAPRLRKAVEDLLLAAQGIDNLSGLAEALALTFPDEASFTDHAQIRVALACMKAGLTASVDLFFPDFDTHGGNDAGQLRRLTEFNEGVHFFWQLAEQLELTSRMRVVLNSDFGRTPVYNDSAGKDHWPIGSMIFMQTNQTWTNRTLGATHPTTQDAFGLRPDLSSSEGDGVFLKPRHLHHVMRNWLDLPANHPLVQKSPLFRADENDFHDFAAMLELDPRANDAV